MFVSSLAKTEQPPGCLERVLLVGQPGNEALVIEGHLRARGLDVRRAGTAQDGLSAAQSYAPDVLILHWTALDVSGEKFLRLLLDEKLPQLPFVIANAALFDFAPFLPNGEGQAALEAGADALLSGAPRSPEIATLLTVAQRHQARIAGERERSTRIQAKLKELQGRFDSLDSDLIEARKMQQALMRDRMLDFGPAKLSLILRSCGHVGGDLVGHFPICDGITGFFALDVSGHGVSSALMTARLAGYLSGTNPRQNIAIQEDPAGGWRPRSPAAAVADLNELVMEDLETDHYFTILLGYFEIATGKVTMVQAGHPHPALQTADGTVRYVGDGGLPVGLIPGADYADIELTLGPGDRLAILSDGFTEATLKDGTFLAEAGLTRLLGASRSLSGPAMLEALVWDLGTALADEGFQDDLSGVLLEYAGNPKT